jgi:hypothetical protein
VQNPSSYAAGFDYAGGSATMISDHQDIRAARCHLGQDLFNHLSAPNDQWRVAG